MPGPKNPGDPCHLLLETHLLIEFSGRKERPMSCPQWVPYNFSDHIQSSLMRLIEGGAPSRAIYHPGLQLCTAGSRVLRVWFSALFTFSFRKTTFVLENLQKETRSKLTLLWLHKMESHLSPRIVFNRTISTSFLPSHSMWW